MGTTKVPAAASCPRALERTFHLKRITLVASALCFALGALASSAQDRMQEGGKDAMGHDSMEKPGPHGKRGKTDKMDKMEKGDKMGKMDKADKMEKPGAMQ